MIALFVWLGDLDSFRMPHCCNGYIHGKFWYIINKLCAVKWLAGCVAISSSSTHDDVINGNIFRVTGHLCGEFTGARWIPRTKTSDEELWCFFDLSLNKRLSKQSWGWWFETPQGPLWRHSNGNLDWVVRLHLEYALGRPCFGFEQIVCSKRLIMLEIMCSWMFSFWWHYPSLSV